MPDPYDVVVDVGGGRDFTALDDGLASTQTVLVKSGTYTEGTITIDQDNCLIKIEPGSTLQMDTGGLVISGNGNQIEFGPGCTIDNNASVNAFAITISGTDNSIRFKNGCTVGNVNITADRNYFNGGGLSTQTERFAVSGDDVIVEHTSFDSKTLAATGNHAISVTGARCQIKYCKVVNGDFRGISWTGADLLCLGNIILASDFGNIVPGGLRGRVIGNTCIDDSIEFLSTGGNSVIAGNYVLNDISINSSSEDCVVVANKAGSIADSSGTSTVMLNDQALASCAVTGTAKTGTTTESQMVAGGRTLIFTLTNATFRNIPAADLATAWQALLVSDQSEANGFNAEKSTILASGTVVRTSATVTTITYAAAPSYSTTIAEDVYLTPLDTTVLESENGLAADDNAYNISTGS